LGGYGPRNTEGVWGGTSAQLSRRILSVIETLGLGGAEHLLVTMHRHLDRTRFEPAVACLFGPNPLAKDLRSLDVPVHELGLAGPRELISGILRLRRLVVEERVDVVHTHLYYANVAGRFGAWGSARVVTTLHNPDYTYEDPGTFVFRGKKLLDQLTGRWINKALVAVSDEVRRDFEQQLGFSGVQVIPNYIDLEAFKESLDRLERETVRKELGLREHDVLVLHVGRLHHQKGQDLLVDAFASARQKVPQLVLFLVGEGRLRGDLEERTRAANLSAAVRFSGAVGDVTPYYKAADIFVFPSRYEAFGIALLEAMAAGLPVVASKTGGIPELATEEAGLLVPVGDVDRLAAALASLAEDPARRACLGAAARARAAAFDVRLQLPRLEMLYASL
jgi:glycosyltransferase involved in cell wall biosynthesis